MEVVFLTDVSSKSTNLITSMKEISMKTTTIRGGGVATLFSLALILTLLLPIETLSQTTLLNTTPTVGISSLLQTPEIPGVSKLPVNDTHLIQLAPKVVNPDLCSGPLSASFGTGNDQVTFVITSRTCVGVYDQSASSCCKDPYPDDCCWWGVLDGTGNPVQSGFFTCTLGAAGFLRLFCLDPGTYTLSVDVCNGGSVQIKCDNSPQCPQC